MSMVNQVSLLGVVTNVKEAQQSNGALALLFTLRTTELWGTKSKDNTSKHYEYHTLTVKNYAQVDNISKYKDIVQMGNRLLVTGSLRNRLLTIDENENKKVKVTEIDVKDLELMHDCSIDIKQGDELLFPNSAFVKKYLNYQGVDKQYNIIKD